MNYYQIFVILAFAAGMCLADSNEMKGNMTCPDDDACQEQSGVTAKDFAVAVFGDTFGGNENKTCEKMKKYKECMDSEWDDCKVASSINKVVNFLDVQCASTTAVLSGVALFLSLFLSKLAPQIQKNRHNATIILDKVTSKKHKIVLFYRHFEITTI